MPATANQFWPLLLLSLLCSSSIVAGVDAVQPTSLTPPTHSSFLRAAVRGRRRSYLSCSGDPGVCSDREKNPWGGETCCFQRYCKDTMNDPDHCGGCGRRCTFGLVCCGGQCVDVRSDHRHCGSCFDPCPIGCSFGMCDYGGG